MAKTRTNVLAAAAAMAMPALLATAQQPSDSWSLQAPFATTSSLLGNDPITGALLRVAGSNTSLGSMPHTWVLLDGRWHRRTLETPSWLYGFAACATDSWRGRLVAFGGTMAGGATTWTYDGVRWEARATHPLLGLRTGHAMTFDSGRGRIVLFGGRSVPGNALLDDTWEWDGSQWLVRQPGAAPPARYEHRLAFDAARGRTVLFGGRTGIYNAFLGDTWEWDGTYWMPRMTVGAPSARYLHGMVYDDQRQRVVLSGGAATNAMTANDAWEWDGSRWTQTIAGTTPPPSTLRPTDLVFDARTGTTLSVATDLEEFTSYTGSAWSPTKTAPLPRMGSSFAYDAVRDEAVLFGGTAFSGGPYGDTWRWRGNRWIFTPTGTAPSARYLAAMAADGSRGELVLFGGYFYATSQPQQYFGDTWTWNGTSWVQRSTPVGPSARSGNALAYHAPTQRIVLFGGNDATTEYADTWLWDGFAWTQATPTQSPSARTQASAVARPSDILLFGGARRTVSPLLTLNDTWTWNGTTWTQEAPATSPSARYGAAATYDADRNRVLLLGGSPSPNQFVTDETWQFDGNGWTLLATIEAPLVRSNAAMTYDVAGKRSLLFGGMRSGPQNDLWALAPVADQAPFGVGCAGPSGAPLLSPSPGSTSRLGGVAAAHLDNLPHSFALVAMGFSDTATGTTQLPLALAPYGMPGCSLLVAPDAVALALGSQGNATWQLSIPFVTALAGLQFYLQAFALDPAANAAGATVSNGLAYRVGG
jgi:hypothetical protein